VSIAAEKRDVINMRIVSSGVCAFNRERAEWFHRMSKRSISYTLDRAFFQSGKTEEQEAENVSF
jgi:hypothetical protein